MSSFDLRSVSGLFHIYGDFVDAAPYGGGHINDTFAVTFCQSGTPVRYIIQRINHNVFRMPSAVMENIERVTNHLRQKLEEAGAEDMSRRVLTLVPTRDGRRWECDEEGNHWRCYLFIENAKTYDRIENTKQAYEAAWAFGEFQKQLADIPSPRLRDTVPKFHHTRNRFEVFKAAVAQDVCNRAAGVREEIDFILQRENMVDVLLDLQGKGIIPERVTHNDTKLNNVMLDDQTHKAVCVIDLDTVMPGLVLYDFGDLCRSCTRPTVEDEQNLDRVVVRLDMFEALVRGYIASAGEFLNAAEKEHLAFSAKLITFETGIRFLTDYLQGDKYFKIHRDGQNLDRVRVHNRLVHSIEQNEDQMNRIVRDVASG